MSEDKSNAPKAPPRLFVSYSWTDTNHVDWVMQLATDLRDHGVDAIIDQWHLKEGHDSHSFMEQMVRDEGISKVILVCDEKYVQRANDREGGVGVESQIITKKIYSDVGQTKFVPIVLASMDDGDALLPTFLSNRIYVDFRNPDEYAQGLTKLLRLAFDKPLHALPQVGERPKFLDDQISYRPISVSNLRLGKQSVPAGQGGEFLAFWREARNRHADFTLDLSGEDGDQEVVDAIDSLPPLLSQMIVSVRERADIGELDPIEVDELIYFFETALANYGNGGTNWSGDVTKFFAQFLYVSVVAILMRCRRFKTIKRFLESPVLKIEDGGITSRAISISRLNTNISSLDYRNQRLSLNRVSLCADIVMETCSKVPLESAEFLQAEFYLFLYFDRAVSDDRWWPDSNIYAVDRYGAFPLFARATQPDLREELLGPLKLATKQEMEVFQQDIKNDRYQHIRWRSAFSQLDIWELGNFQAILDSFD